MTAGGKNVAPAVLEDRLRAHALVDQCMVVGDGQPVHRRAGHPRPRGRRRLGRAARQDRRRSPTSSTTRTCAPRSRPRSTTPTRRSPRPSRSASSRSCRTSGPRRAASSRPSLKLKRNVVMREHRDDVAALYARPEPDPRVPDATGSSETSHESTGPFRAFTSAEPATFATVLDRGRDVGSRPWSTRHRLAGASACLPKAPERSSSDGPSQDSPGRGRARRRPRHRTRLPLRPRAPTPVREDEFDTVEVLKPPPVDRRRARRSRTRQAAGKLALAGGRRRTSSSTAHQTTPTP